MACDQGLLRNDKPMGSHSAAKKPSVKFVKVVYGKHKDHEN